MNMLETKAYQQAFIRYLRKGTPIALSLKEQERITTHYIWRTAGDGKVRASHAANEGKIFAWDTPPPTGHPGEDYNCRCTAEPYYGVIINDPPIEPVYPELLIIPLLRVPRLVAAWRAWALRRESDIKWELSKTKSPQKWANQMQKGNWTPEKINDTIQNGIATPVKNERTGGAATLYEKGDSFLVQDDTTKEILQLSRPDFIAKKF